MSSFFTKERMTLTLKGEGLKPAFILKKIETSNERLLP